MEFFKTNTKIPFMRQRIWTAVFSTIIIFASVISLSLRGLNLGLDFTGGTSVEVSFPQTTSANELRQKLVEGGFDKAVVQAFSVTDYSIRLAPRTDQSQEQLKEKLLQILPTALVKSLSYIGPQVGKSLVTNGILAVIVSFICIMIYIALRFEYRFALSAALALAHDPLLILGIFSFFQIEFNLIVLAAVLTVIGYSLNDTIVVYDRVRENFRKVRKGTPLEIMDLSINQTLSRTIMTSGLTLLVVIALLIFGGPTLYLFALPLTIGIVIGTYSSIYVAGSLAIAFGLNRSSLLPATRRADDDMP
ncbi:MAG: protein-export membrane protein SecF [Gammaproteobacteria bacterium RIFCSPHIGHO2_12_FULL_41_15]|nr:MAG: protein-export membrane protein SecF [Gammaproteobacteria bacterium RIFCSPHIGHO2_12_FULL_41_15]